MDGHHLDSPEPAAASRQSVSFRLLLLKWTVCAAVLAGMALSPKLWTADRGFPPVPALDFLPDLPSLPTLFLTAAFVVSVVVVAVVSKPGRLMMAVPVLGALLVLFDINRLQPWFYQYLLMFAALSFIRWDDTVSARSRTGWAICGIIVASIYFWSGLQKVSLMFATDTFPWLLEPLDNVFQPEVAQLMRKCWYLAPAGESLLAVLLLIPATRTIGLLGALGMHGFVMYLLGPLGHDFNTVVWPWNLAMVLLGFGVFCGTGEPVLRHVWRSTLGRAVFILVVLMPGLSFVDRWDDYLSASLYSGKVRDGWLTLTDEARERIVARLPSEGVAAFEAATDAFGVDVVTWSLEELNVPCYPETRVFRGVGRKLLRRGLKDGDVVLYVQMPPPLQSVERETIQFAIP